MQAPDPNKGVCKACGAYKRLVIATRKCLACTAKGK